MDAQTFRSQFPEFADTAAYPDAQVTMWVGVGVARVNADRWGALTDLGIALFTAHNLALGRTSTKAAAFGGTPGQNTGPLSQKTVDKASASYDTGAGSTEGDGNWNLTTYGTRFMDMVRLAGAGGFYSGGDDGGGAWLSQPWA